MKKFFCFAAAGALALLGSPVVGQQTVIVEDNFDAYSNNGDVVAAPHWDAFAGTAELSTEQAFSGANSIKIPAASAALCALTGGHPGVAANTLSETNPLIVTVMYFDADSTVGAVSGVGLRTGLSYGAWTGGTWGATAFQDFFSMGPFTPTNATNYHLRVVEGGGWQDTGIARETGWREFQLVMTDTTVTAYVDGVEGAVTDQFDDDVTEFNSMRLGDFQAAANSQDVWLDDFSVVVGLPEDPTSVQQWHLH